MTQSVSRKVVNSRKVNIKAKSLVSVMGLILKWVTVLPKSILTYKCVTVMGNKKFRYKRKR